MSFAFLTLSLYLIMMIVISIILISYVVKEWNRENKTLLIGLLVLGLSSLGVGISRVTGISGLYEKISTIITMGTIWLGLIGTVLVVLGAFLKVKNNPYRGKLVLIIIVSFTVTVALLVGPVIFDIYFR